jgi:hypothetical protein
MIWTASALSFPDKRSRGLPTAGGPAPLIAERRHAAKPLVIPVRHGIMGRSDRLAASTTDTTGSTEDIDPAVTPKPSQSGMSQGCTQVFTPRYKQNSTYYRLFRQQSFGNLRLKKYNFQSGVRERNPT